MKLRWGEIAARVDALNMRERAMLFAALMVAFVALPYSLIVSPSLATQRSILQRMQQDQGRMDAVQKELANLLASQTDDVSSENQVKLSTLQQELERIEKRVREQQALLVPADKVPELIRGVLKKSASLQLVSFNTLGGAPILAAQAAAPPLEPAETAKRAGAERPPSPPAAPSAPAGPASDLYKQGFEIAVSGNYLDLLQFLAEVEKSPWRLLWGRVEVKVEKYPTVTMKVTVYTLSSDRAAVSL